MSTPMNTSVRLMNNVTYSSVEAGSTNIICSEIRVGFLIRVLRVV